MPPLAPLDVSPAKRFAPFLILASVFLAAAAGARWHVSSNALAGWLSVHLALAGGVSLLIIGAAQFFACAILATAPQPSRLAALQAGSWSLGVVAVGAARTVGQPWLAPVGVMLAGAALLMFTASLRSMQRRSLQRATWALRWYYACTAFAAAGGLLGGELWRGASWAPGDLRMAHVTLMVLGWCGTAIVGTVHTLLPTMARRPLALPALQRPTFVAWTGGVALLAAGFTLDAWPISALGAMAIQTATLVFFANVMRTAGALSHGLPARLLVCGQASLAAATTLGLAIVPSLFAGAGGAPLWAALVTLFAAGWIGATVLGSLLHLCPIVIRALTRA